MKKLGVILISLCFVILLISTVQAAPYTLLFDADGTGVAFTDQQIWGWDLEGVSESENTLPGSATQYSIITHQDLGGDNILNDNDTFTESFTAQVRFGLDNPDTSYDTLDPYYGPARLYLDITLGGFITNYSNGGDGDTTAANPERIENDSYLSIFTTGSARMYQDINTQNLDYDAGEPIAADLTWDDASPFFAVPSLYTGAIAPVTLSFQFNSGTLNADYFDTVPGWADVFDLVSNGWLFTITAGSLNLAAYAGISPNDSISLAWSDNGYDARLEVIPEPTSMLLLGTGLVGLAGAYRRKKSGTKNNI